jgi:hypothetical protein
MGTPNDRISLKTSFYGGQRRDWVHAGVYQLVGRQGACQPPEFGGAAYRRRAASGGRVPTLKPGSWVKL